MKCSAVTFYSRWFSHNWTSYCGCMYCHCSMMWGLKLYFCGFVCRKEQAVWDLKWKSLLFYQSMLICHQTCRQRYLSPLLLVQGRCVHTGTMYIVVIYGTSHNRELFYAHTYVCAPIRSMPVLLPVQRSYPYPYKWGCKPCCKPRPKHPVKVHVWAVISHRGRAKLCIFEEKMNPPLFISILRSSLLLFINEFF